MSCRIHSGDCDGSLKPPAQDLHGLLLLGSIVPQSTKTIHPNPCSMDDGTLTRTMKPCRPKIRTKYASEVKSLEAALR